MTGRVVVAAGDLDDPGVVRLLADHLADMNATSPPESVHALDVSGLRAAGVSFWTACADGSVLGCVALKELDPVHGELKSMRVDAAARGRGLGALLLDHVLTEARRRGYERVSLETGSMPFFEPARRLYARSGFMPCPPFADYLPDPNSVFLTLDLAGPPDVASHSPTAEEAL